MTTAPATLLSTAAELDALGRAPGARRAVVMTMGALHEGHATLIRAARAAAGPDGQVVVTVFVNPLQFGEAADLDRYPRTLDADLAVASEAGADAVFAPAVEEVYPGGDPQVRITSGPMGERLEGAHRPGHFDGMLTVVAKLLHLTRPDAAFFGQKDAQQLALVRRMVGDLNFGIDIVAVPTVRDPDGLALSSRNRLLSPDQREAATCLFLALSEAAELARAGERDAGRLVAAMAREIGATSEARIDYVAVVDEDTFEEVATIDDRARALVAARFGAVRLIDTLLLPAA